MSISLSAVEILERVIDRKIKNALDNYKRTNALHRGVEVLGKDKEGTIWVHIPGGAEETPVDLSYADVSKGDYGTLRFENGMTILEANTSNPPISRANYDVETERAILMATDPINSTLKSITADLGQFKILKADYAEIAELVAQKATIEDLTVTNEHVQNLVAENVTINNRLDANEANITTLTADNATINGKLTAAEADIGNLQAADATITGRLTAAEGVIDNLDTNYAHITNGVIDNATIGHANVNGLNANYAHIANGAIDNATIDQARVNNLSTYYAHITNGEIDNATIDHADVNGLAANYATITNLNAEKARIDTIESNYVTTAVLNADIATINNLIAGKASIADLNAATADIDDLKSTKADISLLESDYITTAVIEANYAKVDFSNATAAWIQNGVIKNGAITNAMINDVSADKLTAGTIDASRINVTNLQAKNISVEKINGVSVSGKSIADALTQHESDISDLDSKIDDEVDALNDRIDGAIETFTGTAVPTLNNSPASGWKVSGDSTATNKNYAAHVGDVYYVVNDQVPQNGYCYRFTYIDNSYQWQLIKDSDVTAALQRLQQAEGDIDGLETRTATIEQFDEEIATFKTDTESELSTLMTRTTTLETNVSTAQSTANGALVENVQLWFTKANATAPGKPSSHVSSTATTGNAWTTKVPVYNASYPHYYYCYEYKKADGSYAWSDVVHDEAMCESQAQGRKGVSDAAAAKAIADKNVKSSIQLWFTKANDTAPSKPSVQIVSTATTGNAWTTRVPAYNASYPKYFYCYQYELADGTYAWSDVVEDKAMAEVQSTSRTAASNASSALTQLTTKVETSVFNETKQTVEENSNAITTLNTTTQQLRTDVDGKASQSDLTSLTTTVNSVKQTADTNKASITSLNTTTQTLREDLDGLEIGGRNLLKWTSKPVYSWTSWNSNPSTSTGWGRWSNIWTVTDTDDGIKGTSTNANSSGFAIPLVRENAVIGGEEYVLSFDYRTNRTSFGDIYLLCASGGNVLAHSNVITASISEWKHYEQVITWPSTANKTTRALLVPYFGTENDWFEIRDASMKLEKGNRATDWTPAPEDTEASITEIRTTTTNKFNEVEQTLDGIETSIGEIQNDLTEKADGSTVSTLTSRVNTISDTVDGHTQTIQSVQQTQTTQGNTLKTAIKSSTQLWFSKADTTAPAKPTSHVSSTATTGNAWTTAVPAYNSSYPNYFYCYEWQYTDGNYGWSGVTRDIAMGESQAQARKGVSDAAAAQTTANNAATAASTADGKAVAAQNTANKNVKTSVQLWFTKANDTAPSKPASKVTTNNAATGNAWNLAVPTYNASYKHYFYCYQYELADGTYTWSDVVYDRATTENQATSRAASAGVTTLTTKTNEISDTVDGHTSTLTSITTTQSTIQQNAVKSSVQLWFTKANTTAPGKPTAHVTTNNAATGNAWNLAVPTYNASYPNYYYCYEYQYLDGSYGWSAVTRDIATEEAQSMSRTAAANASTAVSTANTASSNASTALSTANTAKDTADAAASDASDAKADAASAVTTAGTASTNANTALSTANTASSNASTALSTANTAKTTADTAKTTANANIKSSVQLWFSKANATAPNKPTSQVTINNAATGNAWNIAVPTYNASYPHYFYCYQQQKGDGTYQWTDVVYDRATTETQSTSRTAASSLASYITSNDAALQLLQNQVDGQIEAWYKSVDPTSSNEPASTWTTATLMARHEGDLYYNVVNGHSWRWMASGSTYSWQQIPDSDAAAALAAAQDAQTTANGKRRIFTSTPTVPYDVGDLWVDGTQVKYATVSRSSGSYTASDWEQTATDDTAANAAQATADKNLKTSQQLWFTKANSTAPSKPTAKVTSTATTGNAWTTKVPVYSATYPHYFYCMQYIASDGTVTWSDVIYDQATTEAQSVARTAAANYTSLQTDYANYKQTTTESLSQIGTTYATKTELSQASSASEITKNAEGQREITTTDAAPLPLITLTAYGESVQDGTPSPDSPVYIEAVRSLNYTKIPEAIPVAVIDEVLGSSDVQKTGTTSSGSAAIIITYNSFISKETADLMSTQEWVDSHEVWIQYDVKASAAGCVTTGNLRGSYSGYSGECVAFSSTTRLKDGTITNYLDLESENHAVSRQDGTSLFNSEYFRTTDTEWHTVLYKLNPQYNSSQPWRDGEKTRGGFAFTLVPTAVSAATYAVKNVKVFTGRVKLVNLKGNELHGLDDTYRDQLDILADGTVQLTKRTSSVTIDGTYTGAMVNASGESGGLSAFYFNRSSWTNILGASPQKYFAAGNSKFKCDRLATRISTAYRTSTTPFITAWGDTSATFIMGLDSSVTTRDQAHTWLNSNPVTIIYPLDDSYWYTISLGKIDLPQVDDGSVVHVAAEVQPYIDASWWTKAGYSVGRLAQQSKESQGTLEAPYIELEWVESNGTQYVYLDWKPPMETWGFEADFIIYNAFNTTQGGWNPSTNRNNGGCLFGTSNSSNVNGIEVSTYSATGFCRIGGTSGGSASNYDAKWKKDKTRQQIKLHGTTLTCADGSTVTVTRATEVANKPYANMTVFAYHNGVRRSGTGNVSWPGSVRIYSLKFYDGDELKVDLVGAKRKKDGMTGLYDKVKGHFYPAKNLLCGNEVGDLGESDTVVQALNKQNLTAYIDNRTISRMWEVEVPTLDKLEDGQQITVIFQTNIGSSTPNQVAAAGIEDFAGQWDETVTSNYANVYLRLILSDSSKTDWIPCYYSQGGRLTSHYGSGTPVLLTYHENMKYGETTTGIGYTVMRGWWADPNYTDGNTTYTRYSDTVIAGKNGIKRYTLLMKDDEGNWTSITTTANSTSASAHAAYTGPLQLGNILYAYTGAEYAPGANSGQVWETWGGLDFRYSVNGVENNAANGLELRKPVYLVGTLGSDGYFYLDTTKWWTQTEPVSADGKIYVLVGTAYSSYYAIFLAADNPAYEYRELPDGTGKFMEFSYSRITKNQTDIIQTNNQITLSAASTLTAAKGYTDGQISTEVTNRNAAITTKADLITASVAQTYTTKTEFDNLQVGSRNLMQGSMTISSASGKVGWMTNGNLVAEPDIVDLPGVGKAIHFKKHTTSNTAVPSITTRNSVILEWGKTYAYGYDVMFSAPVNIGTSTIPMHYHRGSSATGDIFDTAFNNGMGIGSKGLNYTEQVLPANTWIHLERLWETAASAPDSSLPYPAMRPFVFGNSLVTAAGSVEGWIRNPYVIEATALDKVTWTPAPEDLETRVTSAEAAISVNADNIISKVSSTDYNGSTIASLINQSADSVKIQANHLMIDGTTVFGTNSTLATYLGNNYDAKGAAQEAVDNLEIGGRNLFLNTADSSYWTLAGITTSVYSASNKTFGTDSDLPGFHVMNITRNANTNSGGVYANLYVSDTVAKTLTVGETYVLSFMVKASTTGVYFTRQAVAEAQTIVNSVNGEATWQIPTSWTRYWVSFTCKSAKQAVCFYTTGTASAVVSVAQMQLEKGTKPTAYHPAPEDTDAAIDAVDTKADNVKSALVSAQGSHTILWNYSNFSTADPGEAYICKIDPLTNTKSDVNPTVMWNGAERTITKQMINPNTVLPYNVPIYIVARLGSASATTATNYMVWYASGWKYAACPTPSAVGGTWTWAEATDIILGKFVETASEAAFTECEIYNPPWSSKQLTTNTTTSQSAYNLANTANTNATNATAVVDVYPTAVDYVNGTATLAVRLTVNGVAKTPTGYVWTKGPSQTAISGGTTATLNVTDLNDIYNCKVTW